MTVAVVGGLDRLEKHYSALADEHEDVEIKVFSKMKRGVNERIANADGIVLVTGLISHATAKEVYRLARRRGVPVLPCHRGSVSALRECIAALSDPSSGCTPEGCIACPKQRAHRDA